MARVLIAWELGANSGHGVKIAALARDLTAAGHQVDFALQRLDAARAFRDLAEAPGVRLRQAPFWPGLLSRAGPVAAWGDVLAEAGMRDSGVLEYLLRGWDSLLADAAPDLVVAEFAPAAQLAAFGRIKVAAFGTGYTVPEGPLVPFGPRPLQDEAQLCALVNHALTRLGRPGLTRLARIADADLHLPCCFTEMDPYAAARQQPPLPPFIGGDLPPPGHDRGDVFAYLPQAPAQPAATLPESLTALVHLARQGTPVRLHAPGLPAPWAEALAAAGLHLVGRQSLAEIAQARLVVGQGGLGLTSACLALGLPQALAPLDAEKDLNTRAACALGAAIRLTRGRMAEDLAQAARDSTLAARARALAPGFAARLSQPPARIALQKLLTLLNR